MRFTLPPDWQNTVTVTIEFATDIFTSDDFTELRSAMRDRPRLSWQYRTWATGEVRRQIENDLASAVGASDAIMPLSFMRLDHLPDQSFSDGTLFSDGAGIDTQLWQGHVDSVWVAGCRSWLESGVEANVGAVEGPYVRIDAGYESAVPEGAWALCGGTLNLDVSQPTAALSRYAVSFVQDPGSPFHLPEGVSETTVEGLEVFPFTVNWRNATTKTFEATDRVLDYGLGALARQQRTTRRIRGMTGLLSRTATDLHDRFILFFVRHKGRRDTFWLRDWSQPHRVAAFVPAGQRFFETASPMIIDDYQRRLALPDGSSVRVDWIEGNTVHVDDGLPEMDVGDAVTWLLKARFAEDRLETVWRTNRVFESNLSVRLLEVA